MHTVTQALLCVNVNTSRMHDYLTPQEFYDSAMHHHKFQLEKGCPLVASWYLIT